jgi:hypothetical protein
MGSADCRAYSRNKRGIAGSLVWINFDRHALLNLFAKAAGRFVSTIDEIRPQFQDDGVSLLDQTAIFNSKLVRTSGVPIGATINLLDNVALNAVSSFKALAQPWYTDQILPFDVTLAGTKEYGAWTWSLPRPAPLCHPPPPLPRGLLQPVRKIYNRISCKNFRLRSAATLRITGMALRDGATTGAAVALDGSLVRGP